MKRNKFVAILALASAMTMTACDTPITNTTIEPGETVVETTIVGTDESGNPIVETVIVAAPTKTPSTTPGATTTESGAKATPTATATTSATATSATTTAATTATEATTKATENSEGSSSDSGDSGSGSGSSSSEGSSSGGSSSGGGNATVPTTPPTEKPTEPTSTTASSKYVAHLGCGSCGCETLVDTPHYHYTTPEQTHQETTESWDYGIQHSTLKINWMAGAYTLGDPPTIEEYYDYEVDTDGNPIGDWTSAQNVAIDAAFARANEWLKSVGATSYAGYYSYSSHRGSVDMVGYEVTTITVVDEPEHEYEVGAYICDTCGAVETYGTPTQIR